MENIYEYQLPQFEQEAQEAAKTEVSLGIAGEEKRMRLGRMGLGKLRSVADLLDIHLPRVTLYPIYGQPGVYRVHEDVRVGCGFTKGVWVDGPLQPKGNLDPNYRMFKDLTAKIRKQHIMITIARVMATREVQKARRQAYAPAR